MSKLLKLTSRLFAPVICCRFIILSSVLFLFLLHLPDGVIAATLQNGSKLSDSISAAGEVDEHTFQANAGDSIYLRVADTETTEFVNSAFTPLIELIDPTGASILSNSGALVGDIFARLVTTGEYLVRVSDASSFNPQTGTYNLFFVRAPGANEGGQLVNGGVVSDNIELGDLDSYTFDGVAGESVYLRVADTETTEFIDSAFFPNVALVDPSGVRIEQNSGALVGDIFVTLVRSGTYTVVIMDESSGEDATGSYDLHFVKTPGANEGGSLINGQRVSGFITLGDVDSYTFDASPGESVYLRVADRETTEFVSAAFSPNMVLFDPNGAFVSSGSDALVVDLFVNVVLGGTYTVIINDESFGEDAVGSYDLYFVKAPGANELGALPNGGVVSDEIDLADLDSYTFFGRAGESIFLRVADTETTDFISSLFSPEVAVVDPNGVRILRDSGALVGDIFATLSVTGIHTVVVYDESSGEDATGSYNLYFALAPGANEGGGISDGDSIDGFIDLGDLDSFAFTANAGTAVSISMTDLADGPLSPAIAVFGSTGNLIESRSGSEVAVVNFTTTETGLFTLVLRDESFGEDAAGPYRVELLGQGVQGVSVSTCNGLPVSVFIGSGDSATSGPDVILGTSGNDVITAMGGDDTICGLDGNDTIIAGNGNDWVDAGPGNDTVEGGNGDDEIYGDAGVDILNGGPNDDEIFGEGNGDFINGNSGDDLLDGGFGVDQLRGGSGNDVINTGSGGNRGSGLVVTGGAGNDIITGGPGTDEIRGESGNDTILGLSLIHI